MWFIGVEVEQETSAPPPKKILDPPLNQSHAVCLRARGIHDIDRQQKRNFLVDVNERVIQHYSCTGYLIDYFVK